MSEMTVEQLQAAQAAEYGEYVATEPILIGGVRAFNVGDPVPKGHVKSGVVDKAQVGPPPEVPAPDAKANKDKSKSGSSEGNV